MAKVKISKKSTRIDMTAMCDVAFLLLSFFIMSGTATQPEPKVVDVPASTVIDKLPDDVAIITVGDNQTFIDIPKDIRRATLENMSAMRGVNFSEEDYASFERMEGFGVPLNQLRGLLAMEPAQRNAPGLQTGIPFDSISDQLGDWVRSARSAHEDWIKKRRDEAQTPEERNEIKLKDLELAIKGNADENFKSVARVIEILQEQRKNKFFLVTNLRGEDF
jgi:biopolymer transport protein ExbD